MPNLRILRASIFILALIAPAATALADGRTAADVLLPSMAVFVEIRNPSEVLNRIYDHKLVRRIEELDQVRSAMEKKEYLNFKAGVAVIESQMGMPWRKIVSQDIGGGIAAALDIKTHGVVILTRSTDEATPAKLLETLANLVSIDAKNKGNPDPVTTSEYRGFKTYAIDKAKYAAAAGWLVITNHDELGKQIVDRILDQQTDSLAADSQFAKAHASASTTVWGYVNTAAIRESGFAKKLFDGQADNPLAEVVFGGILTTLQHTPYVTFGLQVNDQQIRFSASAPFDRAWAGEAREYYFGPQGQGTAPTQLSVDGAILCLTGYRDVSTMWRRAGDLLNEQTSEELAKADSSLSTLFSGKDFGEDILGAFRPEGQIVVARQEFEHDQPAPAIKLPAFGLVAEMKDPAKMQPELRRIFQSLIGFLNIVGAMNGQPQLELDMERTDAGQFVTSSYLPEAKAKDSFGLKINYNFSPSIAFVGSRFVVASTKAMAHTLATAKGLDRSAGDGGQIVNTDGVLHFDALKESLRDNRAQLVAQNMLTEGHSKEEAEKRIELLLELVGYFDRLGLTLDTTPDELHLSLDIALKATE